MTVICEQCDPPREFANAGALRFHAIGKHKADAGHCDLCDKDFDRLSQHMTKTHSVDRGGSPAPTSGPGEAPAPASSGDEGDDRERPPLTPPGVDLGPSSSDTGAKQSLRDKVRGKLWGGAADTTAPAAPKSKERAPRTAGRGKRNTTAPIGSLAWGGAGALLERTGADVPVGRTMQFQADAAGDILDRLIANTWADRVLQPFAEKTDELESLAALFALPVLVATVERSPAASVALEPVLREVVRANIMSMSPVIKRKKADAKKLADVIAELDPELAASGADPVETILGAIFRPPQEPEPAANGHVGADIGG